MRYLRDLVLLFAFLGPLFSYAQEQPNHVNDTLEKKKFFERIIHYFEEAKKDKSQSEFDISFIGGPSYSVDTKLGLGLVASGLYRLDRENLDLSPSNVSIYTNITTSGFFAIGVENNTIFPDDKFRINADMSFTYMPSKYYGIGYDAGDAGIYSKYNEYRLSLKADFLAEVVPNGYMGVTFAAKNLRGSEFEKEEFQPQENLTTTLVGGGLIFSYDTRDFIPNPEKGIFLQYQQTFFSRTLGSNIHFSQIETAARYYKRVSPKTILAFDFNGIFNNGDVPWNMMAQIGGPRQMRGYLTGQYRDRKELNTQVEWRQKIYNRHGVVLWGGMGTVFDKFKAFTWSETLPTYGIGYRWEFKNRVNIRFDYGIARGQSGFYFNINEAF
ncbi:BamA/TamA family outer membrane protein [Myroides sp. NP-2]|uniref:BamA/TamA family outer membrane protein n=1 Tax=Myroides sp. NP-2 TaxID=2759945 RepID=UPI0015FD1FC2|nr:BamA/TamA family outer membrane protein [Myroides sp. NP-2]MBB1148555.1 BamA/TamA family outer membrane protein [Myroides sp. NP-2]